MKQETKRLILKEMYRVYSEFVAGIDLACEIGCAECCTCNVTMTSLEGYGALNALKRVSDGKLLKTLRERMSDKKFHPQITTNGLANVCANDEAIPVEEIDPDWGICPLLTDKKCPIYEARPFECRSFSSKVNCSDKGFADMDSFVMVVNNLFRQYIEHVDSTGVTGNLTDVILLLDETDNQEVIWSRVDQKTYALIPNEPLKVLMIPPEYREKIQPIIDSLRSIKVQVPE